MRALAKGPPRSHPTVTKLSLPSGTSPSSSATATRWKGVVSIGGTDAGDGDALTGAGAVLATARAVPTGGTGRVPAPEHPAASSATATESSAPPAGGTFKPLRGAAGSYPWRLELAGPARLRHCRRS